MKANEAPKKIQIHFIKNDYDDWSVRGYSFLEDKQIGMTEYVRTDAFIEKAEEFIYTALNDGVMGTANIEDFIRLFKNYMKGE